MPEDYNLTHLKPGYGYLTIWENDQFLELNKESLITKQDIHNLLYMNKVVQLSPGQVSEEVRVGTKMYMVQADLNGDSMDLTVLEVHAPRTEPTGDDIRQYMADRMPGNESCLNVLGVSSHIISQIDSPWDYWNARTKGNLLVDVPPCPKTYSRKQEG